MKRLTILAAIVLSALTAATATAATPSPGQWKGTKIALGKNLKFTVKGGKITKVSAFVLERCDGDFMSRYTTFAPDTSWKVKGGKFSGRHKESFKGGAFYFTLKGRFTSATTAVGKLRSESIVAGSTCDTLDLAWKAKKG